MIDVDEVVQRTLEGRCVECGLELPRHTAECSEYPVNILTKKLTSVKNYVSDRQQRIKDIIEQIDDIQQRNDEILQFLEEHIRDVRRDRKNN